MDIRYTRRTLLAVLGAGLSMPSVLRVALAQSPAQGLRTVRGEVNINGKPV